MTGRQAPRPEQWTILWRLRAAYCPVDLEHLPAIRRPIWVCPEPSPCGIHLFPISGGAALVLPLRIVAQSVFSLRRVYLQGDWIKTEVSWLMPCAQHGRDYCFHEYRAGHSLRFPERMALDYKLREKPEMKTGDSVPVLALAFLPGLMQFQKEEKRTAMIWLEDRFGDKYPFNVVLDCGQEPNEGKYTVIPERYDGEAI